MNGPGKQCGNPHQQDFEIMRSTVQAINPFHVTFALKISRVPGGFCAKSSRPIL